jgi:hypothetical protein
VTYSRKIPSSYRVNILEMKKKYLLDTETQYWFHLLSNDAMSEQRNDLKHGPSVLRLNAAWVIGSVQRTRATADTLVQCSQRQVSIICPPCSFRSPIYGADSWIPKAIRSQYIRQLIIESAVGGHSACDVAKSIALADCSGGYTLTRPESMPCYVPDSPDLATWTWAEYISSS